MSLHVSIDFGTSSTCTVVSVGGGEPQVVVIDGQPLVPSAVFAAADGTLFVGHEAERQAAVDPSRFEPHPKRRIDEGELLLGSSVLKVAEVVRSVLRRAVDEARRYAGGAVVDLLVLTHPADWGALRAGELRGAAAGLAKEVVLVPEPVAAAVFHSAGNGLAEGAALAVLDLGGGTVDASVVRKQGARFQVLATKGDPNFGGADIDQALLEHIGGVVAGADPEAWRRLVEGRDMADRRRRRVLRQDVRGAKETLSRHTYTDVPMPPPFSDAHVTRADLEALIAEPLSRAADLVLAVLRDGGVPRGQLSGVFLVGGSSRIPLVSRLLHERTGVVPTTLDQPETVVARGALRAVRLDPDRTGGLAPAGGYSGPAVRRPPEQDPLSTASTIVIGATDRTRPVALPAAPRRTRRGPLLVGAGAAALVVAGVVAALLLFDGGGAAEDSRQARAFNYAFSHPADWRSAEGDRDNWETLLTPVEATPGAVISVQQGGLTYNAEAGRDRAVQELRTQYEGLVSAGRPFSHFDPDASFSGRDVVFYQQRLDGRTVNWYVLHEGRFRISVGCQRGAAEKDAVLRACEQVVATMKVR
ncbi:type VII secretion-associated protein [Saccharopolyspora sp. CA-218241]|uniref:type VII secretion-associated protein n=1 Tax=Saccharopolyspora sp. CA-218241 TaxID=3240027 RepID=UPI003D9833F2